MEDPNKYVPAIPEKKYRLEPPEALNMVKRKTLKQPLQWHRTNAGSGSGAPGADGADGAAGEDGAQTSCEGPCHAYFA